MADSLELQSVDPQSPKSATYTPGYSQNATEFMARRTIESHGEFFLPYLTPGVSVLDCGCGPGSITLSIASRVGTGRVVGGHFTPLLPQTQQTEGIQFMAPLVCRWTTARNVDLLVNVTMEIIVFNTNVVRLFELGFAFTIQGTT